MKSPTQFSKWAQIFLIVIHSNKTHLFPSFVTFVLEYCQSGYTGGKPCSVTSLDLELVESRSAGRGSKQLLCRTPWSVCGRAAGSASEGKAPLGQSFWSNCKSKRDHHEHQHILRAAFPTSTSPNHPWSVYVLTFYHTIFYEKGLSELKKQGEDWKPLI